MPTPVLCQNLYIFLQIERQLHSQNQMRERLMAMQVARARELLNWVTVFYVISMTGLFMGYVKPNSLAYNCLSQT